MRLISLVAVVLVCAAADASAAQATQAVAPGSVRVTVRDAPPLPVAGVTVTLAPAAGEAQNGTTTDRGEASFERLAPGTYAARIETAGVAPSDPPNHGVRNRR